MAKFTRFGGEVITTHSHGTHRMLLVKTGVNQVFVSTPVDKYSEKIRIGDTVWIDQAEIRSVSVEGVVESVISPDITRLDPEEFLTMGAL